MPEVEPELANFDHTAGVLRVVFCRWCGVRIVLFEETGTWRHVDAFDYWVPCRGLPHHHEAEPPLPPEPDEPLADERPWWRRIFG